MQAYLARLGALHTALGIPADYAQQRGLAAIPESTALVDAGVDMFGRPVRMDAAALAAWQHMQQTAAAAGIELQLVSAYRSADYQHELLQKKLAQGQTLENILQVNAAPGYSEHHSGRALDLSTPGYECLGEEFELSPAFAWLGRHAAGFGFSMSFPRNNPQGFLYEPWHWCYREQ